jgi:peptide/nickel transport system substrate-binding protein
VKAPAPYTSKPIVVVAIPREPVALDPHYTGDDDARAVVCNIFEPLFIMDGDSLEPVPCLAVGYTLLDALRWEFTIRDGVHFQDGSAFTVDDAVYSVNRAINPGLNIQPAYDLATIEKAEKTGAKTMVITTRHPDPVLLKRLAKLDMVSRNFMENTTRSQQMTITNGTGPYMLDHWTGGQEIVLVRNRNYWGASPALDVAVYRIVNRAADRSAALINGDIDLAVAVEPDDADSLPRVLSVAGTRTLWVRFNQRSGAMASKAMRQAANHAVDAGRIASDIYHGFAIPSEGQIGRLGFFGYSGATARFPHDIPKAKALLDGAGYGGEPIRLLAEKGRSPAGRGLAEVIAAQLGEAGFNVELTFAERQEWLDALFDPKKAPDMQLSYTTNELFDMDGMYSALVHSEGFQSALGNSEYDELIEEARINMDSPDRAEMYSQLALELHGDPFAIYLLALEDIYGAAANLDWAPRQDGRIHVFDMTFK